MGFWSFLSIRSNTITLFSTPIAQNGTWLSVPTEFQNSQSSYLSTTKNQDDELPSAIFKPNINTAGNYTVRLYTPGCEKDNTCSTRGLLNVTGTLTITDSISRGAPVSTVISQTNPEDKYDTVYYGYVDASTGAWSPFISLTPALDQSLPVTVVAQMTKFELMSEGDSDGSRSGTSASPSNSSASTAATSNVATSNAATTITPNTPNSATSTLSTSKIIGIVIGVTFALALLLVPLAIRRRNQKRRLGLETEHQGWWHGKSELPGDGISRDRDRIELHDAEIREADFQAYRPVELPADGLHVELPVEHGEMHCVADLRGDR